MPDHRQRPRLGQLSTRRPFVRLTLPQRATRPRLGQCCRQCACEAERLNAFSYYFYGLKIRVGRIGDIFPLYHRVDVDLASSCEVTGCSRSANAMV